MNDILLAELDDALLRYERNGRFADFITKFLYLLEHGMNIEGLLKRIIPWCQRWIYSDDSDETFMLEKKISLVIDLYLEARKYNAD